MDEIKAPPSTGARLLRAFIAILFGIFLAIFTLEIALRLLGLAPPAAAVGNFWQAPNPDYGWYHIANAAGPSYDRFGEYNVWVTINSHGLREAEIPYEKPEGVYRILLLGDSFAEGMRTELAQTAGKVLEAQLNEMAGAPRFQVISAGVGAWGSDQELLWLRQEGVRYDPDLVLVLFFTANDFMNNSEALEVSNVGGIYKPFFSLHDGELVLKYHPFDPEAPEIKARQPQTEQSEAPAPIAAPLAGWRGPLHRLSALYRFLAPRLQEGPPGLANRLIELGLIEPGRPQQQAALGPSYIPVAYGVFANPRDAAWDDAVALTAALLGQIDAESREMGAEMAVVIVSSQEQVAPAAWQTVLQRFPAMQPRAWDLERPNRDLAEMLNRAGIPFLDLLPVFQARAGEGRRLYLPRDGHWTVEGERLVGETMAAFVRELVAP
ncbi:MAG: hypothetical protein K1X65_10155 [Caldilineales bacterium]|nr:hypothetical protein [Caldilineales bacterium]MCW5859144.1 SGNH/GDSL hydrolase family protein [Caldilineales bacterium]